MRTTSSLVTTLAVVSMCISASALPAQQRADSTARRQEKTLDSLITVIRAMQGQADTMSRPAAAPAAAPAAQTRTSGAYMNVSFVGLTDAGWSTEPNVLALQRGDHDPHVRGFSIPNGELALDGTVDPYFKAFANIVYKLNTKAETGVELEEMFVLSTSLPFNLQVKAGQFFSEFGRQNPQHPHSWAFADEPLVLNRMFGGEGLRSQGARVSWLAPTPFYTEVNLGIMNSAGGTTSSFRSDESSEIHGGVPIEREVRNLGDMLFVPRVATSFDVTNTQTVVLGVSGAFGPNNSGPAAKTQVVGADVYYKWKSPTAAAGFPFVSFQSEIMARRYDAAARVSAENAAVSLPAAALRDHGMYAQLLWGIKPMIVAGFRGEFATADKAAFTTEARADRYRYSPNVTWYPTEFSKFRLQYNYDHRAGIGVDHSLWLQFEFLLGSHAAHKF